MSLLLVLEPTKSAKLLSEKQVLNPFKVSDKCTTDKISIPFKLEVYGLIPEKAGTRIVASIIPHFTTFKSHSAAQSDRLTDH